MRGAGPRTRRSGAPSPCRSKDSRTTEPKLLVVATFANATVVVPQERGIEGRVDSGLVLKRKGRVRDRLRDTVGVQGRRGPAGHRRRSAVSTVAGQAGHVTAIVPDLIARRRIREARSGETGAHFERQTRIVQELGDQGAVLGVRAGTDRQRDIDRVTVVHDHRAGSGPRVVP